MSAHNICFCEVKRKKNIHFFTVEKKCHLKLWFYTKFILLHVPSSLCPPAKTKIILHDPIKFSPDYLLDNQALKVSARTIQNAHGMCTLIWVYAGTICQKGTFSRVIIFFFFFVLWIKHSAQDICFVKWQSYGRKMAWRDKTWNHTIYILKMRQWMRKVGALGGTGTAICLGWIKRFELQTNKQWVRI